MLLALVRVLVMVHKCSFSIDKVLDRQSGRYAADGGRGATVGAVCHPNRARGGRVASPMLRSVPPRLARVPLARPADRGGCIVLSMSIHQRGIHQHGNATRWMCEHATQCCHRTCSRTSTIAGNGYSHTTAAIDQPLLIDRRDLLH